MPAFDALRHRRWGCALLTRSSVSALEKQLCRLLEVFLDLHQKLHGLAAVDDAVIVAEGDVHHRPEHNLTVYADRPILDLVQAEDADLRRIENRRAEQRTEDAAVGDRKRAAGQVLQ